MKTITIISLFAFCLLNSGCAYFSNIYERPKELAEYNYKENFYDLPLETTTDIVIMTPIVCLFSATTEPIDKACFPEMYAENPKATLTGITYFPFEFLVQLALGCSARIVDKVLFYWWLPAFKTENEDTDELETIKENSPYIYSWL